MLKAAGRAASTGRTRLARTMLAFLIVSGCGAGRGPMGAVATASYQEQVDALLDTPPFDAVHWGVLIRSLETGEVVFERNARKKFVPASNMKVLTTAAAAIALGPDFRYRTHIGVRGRFLQGVVGRGDGDRDLAQRPLDGVVEGDLVVRGAGDPTMSSRFYPDSVVGPLDALVDSLMAVGVGRIQGRLVVDATMWDSISVQPTWMIGDLDHSYASTGGPFAVDEGALVVEVRGGAVGTTPRIRRLGSGDDLSWVTMGTAMSVAVPDTTDEIRMEYLSNTRRFQVMGQIAAGTVDTVSAAARHPVELAGETLLKRMERKGIVVDGGLLITWPDKNSERHPAAGEVDEVSNTAALPAGGPSSGMHLRSRENAVARARGRAPENTTTLFVLESPPLMEVVEATLEPSQNWIADQLLKTLGSTAGLGGWSDGRRALHGYLTLVAGADSADLDIRDGSGLSAYNLVTPRALDAVLGHIWTSPLRTQYLPALAEPGEEDSTLERRLAGLEGRVFAKTGTITHVNSLSGYVQADSGQWYSFVILSNGSGLPSSKVRSRIDGIVRLTAAFH